jgi:hypothetical protein
MTIITHALPNALLVSFSRYLSLGLFSISALICSSSQVDAAEPTLKIQSVSQPKLHHSESERKTYWVAKKDELLMQKTPQVSKNRVNVSSGTTRKEHKIAISQLTKDLAFKRQQARLTRSNKNTDGLTSYHHAYPENFTIHDAFSYLLDDVDGDGYYQSFSIVFDADYLPSHYTGSASEQANVYAELYLRQHGGAWQHFHSTDVFSIYGNTSDDEYEVFSTLEQGFYSSDFDVMIDLYYAGSHELVASYSANDNNTLYALPLESVDYDQMYVTEVIYSEGGSSSIILLLLSAFIIALRSSCSKK